MSEDIEIGTIACPRCGSPMKSEHGNWKCSCGFVDDES